MRRPRKRFGDFPRSGVMDRAALPWFEEEDYPRIFEIMNNPGEIPLDYDQWRERAEDLERYWKRDGRLVIRVKVNPDSFLAWCAASAEEPDIKTLESFCLRAARFGDV